MSSLPTDTIFNILLLFSIVLIVASFSVLLVYIYKFLSRWLALLQKGKVSGAEEIKQDAYKKATEMMDGARKRSMQLVSESDKKAKETIATATQISEESKQALNENIRTLSESQANILKKTSSDLISFFKGVVTKQKEEGVKSLIDASHEIEEELLGEVEEFKEILHKETVDAQKEAEAKILVEYEKLKKELDQYRFKQLAAIDENIYDILHDVSCQIFGKAMNMEQHQELIIKSLIEAKENNIFSKS